MAVNMRGRVDIVSEDHAGNYHNPLPYTEEDYKTPSMIRESLGTSYRRAGRVSGTNQLTELPRPSPDLTFSIISNWASFRPSSNLLKEEDEENEDEDKLPWLGDLSLICHLPIMFPEALAKKMPQRMSYLIMFPYSNEDMGCILMVSKQCIVSLSIAFIIYQTLTNTLRTSRHRKG
jgi:hypothetical protein